FPMNFTEALTPWALPPASPWNVPPSSPLFGFKLKEADLPGLIAYSNTINDARRLGLTLNGNSADPRESAYCLVLALQQGFGGNTFSEEIFGANVLGSDPNVIGMKRFLDGWGN